MSSQDPPQTPVPPALRASDADRERTATLLREHTGAGRLTPEELSDRLDVAYAARTVAELETLVHDLPDAAASPATGTARRPARPGARQRVLHATGYAVLITVVCVVVWLATGAAGSFWPKWILLGSAVRLAFYAWAEMGPAPRGEARLGRGGAHPPEADAADGAAPRRSGRR